MRSRHRIAPQSATELAELLEAWLAHLQNPETVTAPERREAQSSARMAKPPSRWRRSLMAIAAGAIVLLTAVIVLVETNKGTIRIESNVDDVPIIVNTRRQGS